MAPTVSPVLTRQDGFAGGSRRRPAAVARDGRVEAVWASVRGARQCTRVGRHWPGGCRRCLGSWAVSGQSEEGKVVGKAFMHDASHSGYLSIHCMAADSRHVSPRRLGSRAECRRSTSSSPCVCVTGIVAQPPLAKWMSQGHPAHTPPQGVQAVEKAKERGGP
eukprot:364443-Chlamydomonas_euryale.AAC.22